jgi:hypothetical protein
MKVWAERSMREIETLLQSLINLDRPTLIAILCTEAQTAAKMVLNARQRTARQRAKRQELIERASRIGLILAYFKDGTINPEMSVTDAKFCAALERRLL